VNSLRSSRAPILVMTNAGALPSAMPGTARGTSSSVPSLVTTGHGTRTATYRSMKPTKERASRTRRRESGPCASP